MEFNPAVYAAISFSFLLYVLLWLISAKSKAPPHAGGTQLLTGHLHLIRGGPSDGLPHINLGTLADKYGPAFTIQLGVRRALVVSSPELVKGLFTTNDEAVSPRPLLKAAKHLGHDPTMFGYSPCDSYGSELHKVVSVELLSSSRIELQRKALVSETAQFINELYKIWENRKDGSGSVLVDMKLWLGDLNLNVVLKTVAGKRFTAGDDEEEMKWYRKVTSDFFHLAGLFVVGDAFPHFGWLDVGGYEKRMKETSIELGKIVGGWLAEHRRKEYSGEDKPLDFMDVMLSMVEGSNLQGQPDVDIIIKATCESLIAGWSYTTTFMLVRTLSLLLNNPHVLKKAQEELDKHVGRESRVMESDIDNLVYIKAIVKEVSRLYPPISLGGPRVFTKDCNVGGYHVSKGTWVIVNLWKLQRDPKVWLEDPFEFRPDRFLSRHKNLYVKGQDYELIPFGAGRRVWADANFGLQMLHLVLANMLQAFEFSTVANEQVKMSEFGDRTNPKATPLNVLVAPRLSSNLY